MAVLRLSCVRPHRWLGVLLYVDSARESSPVKSGGGTLAWVGEHSLEVYLTHGLLLNIFKSSVAIQFSSIEGYLLTAGNFTLTVGLCAVVIRLLNQNAVLKKVLNIR